MKNVDLSKIKAAVCNLRLHNETVHEFELKKKLNNCTDVASVFLVLTGICSWFNHHPLGALIRIFKVDRTAYDTFIHDTLKKFLRKSITEIPCKDLGDDIQGSGKFRLKMDTDAAHENITGERIAFLRGSVARSFDLMPYQLNILSLKDGCIDILFSLPLELHRQIFPLSDKYVQALSKISILISTSYQPIKVRSIQYNGEWHKV